MLQLQAELEETKDAKARLHTQYERIRREKERLDREREDWRQRVAATMDVQGLVVDLLEDIKKMTNLVQLEGIFAEDQSKAQAVRRPLRMGSTPKDDLMNILQKVRLNSRTICKRGEYLNEITAFGTGYVTLRVRARDQVCEYGQDDMK